MGSASQTATAIHADSTCAGRLASLNAAPLMALKATIHKATVNLSDLDRNRYTDHQLTLAAHPSETPERLMLRLLAYVLEAPENNDRGVLEFGKDMWDPDEPCLWQKDLTGLIEHWIDLGQPDEKRLVKASGRSRRVTLYTYGSAAGTWWPTVAERVNRLDRVTVWQIPADQSSALGALADRSMDLQITVQDDVITVDGGGKSVEVTPQRLR